MRKHPRIPVIMAVMGEGFPLPVCFTRDISRGGLYLETVTPLSSPQQAVGKELDVSFCLPYSTRTVRTKARIVRVRTETNFEGKTVHGIGLEFVDPPPDLLAEIDSYIEKTGRLIEDSIGPLKISDEEVLEAADEVEGPYFECKGLDYYDTTARRLLSSDLLTQERGEEHPHVSVLRRQLATLSDVEKDIIKREAEIFSLFKEQDRRLLLEIVLTIVKLETESLLLNEFLGAGGKFSRDIHAQALAVERETALREQREAELYHRIQRGREIEALPEYEKIRKHFQSAIKTFKENVIQRGEESLFEEAMPEELKVLFDRLESLEGIKQLFVDYNDEDALTRIERGKVIKFLSELDEPLKAAVTGEGEPAVGRDLLLDAFSVIWKLREDYAALLSYRDDLFLFRKKVTAVYQNTAGRAVEIKDRLQKELEKLSSKTHAAERTALENLLEMLSEAEAEFSSFVSRLNANASNVGPVKYDVEGREERRKKFRLFGGGKREKVAPKGVRRKKAVRKRSNRGMIVMLVVSVVVAGTYHLGPLIKHMLQSSASNVKFPIPLEVVGVKNDEVIYKVDGRKLNKLDMRKKKSALNELLRQVRARHYDGIKLVGLDGDLLYRTYYRGDKAFVAKNVKILVESGSEQEIEEKQELLKTNPDKILKKKKKKKVEETIQRSKNVDIGVQEVF